MYLVTDRLKVRRMCDEDFPDFLSYGMEPERCRMMGTDLLPDEETAYRAFEWLLRHEKRFYALELRSTGHVIGHLTVYNFPSVSSLPELAGMTGRSLAFCVAAPYRRQGYASEAVSAVVDHLFYIEGVDYVNSGYLDFNGPSRALHHKLGFRFLTSEQVELESGTATGIETILYRPEPMNSYWLQKSWN